MSNKIISYICSIKNIITNSRIIQPSEPPAVQASTDRSVFVSVLASFCTVRVNVCSVSLQNTRTFVAQLA